MAESFPVPTIKSLNDLHKAYRMAREKFKRPPWFRGHWDASWKLLPSVFRPDEHGKLLPEESIANRFKTQAPIRYANCPEGNDYFGWLCLMQHYRLRTRLLDWSESILVAAFFAVTDESSGRRDAKGQQTKAPGAIWALSPNHLFSWRAQKRDDEHGFPRTPDHPGIVGLAADAFGVHLRDLNQEYRHGATIAAIPKEVDLRMLMQAARFTVHGKAEGALPQALEVQAHASLYLMKFEIAEGFKGTLRNMLVELGINEHTLFPDLEHLARRIVEDAKVDEIVPEGSGAEGPEQAG